MSTKRYIAIIVVVTITIIATWFWVGTGEPVKESREPADPTEGLSLAVAQITTTTTAPPTTTTHTHAPRPRASTSRAAERPTAPSGDIWWRLALCESEGRNVSTGNGYYGYFQFLPSTWRSVGGTGLPTDHSYEVQRMMAQRLQARSGWGQWPACSRKLGLR